MREGSPSQVTKVIRLTVNKVLNALRACVAVAVSSGSAALRLAVPPLAALPLLAASAAPAALALAAVPLPALAQLPPQVRVQLPDATGSAFAPDELPQAFIAQRGSLSLAQATQIAQGRFKGRIVRAETVQEGGRVVHVIRILGDDGRVRTVRIDAETGAVR
jgi:hypothetical protein